MEIKDFILRYTGLRYIVVQPTETCNLDCTYCYLPNRKSTKRMDVRIAERLAEDIIELNIPIQLIWHGGEPLTCGVEHMRRLLSPFDNHTCRRLVTQCIQTNAIPINTDWIDLFRHFDVKVGVSIDGNQTHNKRRIFWNGQESYKKTLRGINLLKEADIEFSFITVIGKESLSAAEEIYGFLSSMNPSMIGFNIEETEGINEADTFQSSEVRKFWSTLLHCWMKNKNTPIREFNSMIPMMYSSTKKDYKFDAFKRVDLFPSISVDGDIVLLSPEFVNAKSGKYDDFRVGNIRNKSLKDILKNVEHIDYVRDFFLGIEECKKTCEYFSMCGGGQASNKHFENDNLLSTGTVHCKNTVKNLVEGILEN